jgi:hypothetical protein
VSAIQSAEQIKALLDRLHGREIAFLQVIGINSLKSLSPMPAAVIGEVVTASEVADRIVTVRTASHSIAFDLQRTGRLVWLDSAEPWRLVAGASRPTVRLLLADGSGLDLTEPTKTKRITLTLAAVPE